MPPVVPPPVLPTAVPLSLTFWTAVSVPGSNWALNPNVTVAFGLMVVFQKFGMLRKT